MNLLDKFHFKDKNGIQTTMEICDSFSRSKLIEVIGMIPTKTSELQNDSGFIISADIPTKTSQLQNDSGFITSANIPTKTSQLQNDSGFITSSDVSELQNEVDNITHSTCANLLNPTAQTQTINGVTFTNNGDGTYTVNGTANAQAYILATSNPVDLIPFRGKDIKIVGCPSGGGANKYQFNLNISDASDGDIARVTDYGGGSTYHVPSNAHHAYVVIAVQRGQTANNLLFKPMLTTDLNAKYDDYVPYTGGSGRLNEDVAKINNELINMPPIPTNTSQLTNDSGFITSSAIPSIIQGTYTGASGVTIGGFQVTSLAGLKNCNGFISLPTSDLQWYTIATTSILPSTTIYGSASFGGTGITRDVRWLTNGIVQVFLSGAENNLTFNFNITGY